MKKIYTKPVVIVDNFNLTQTIAAGCEGYKKSSMGHPNQANKGQCGWVIGGASYWIKGVGDKCTFHLDDNASIANMCYNNPSGASSVFGS